MKKVGIQILGFFSGLNGRWIILFLAVYSLGIRLVFINPGFFHHDSIMLIYALEESIRSGMIQPFSGGRYIYTAFNIPFFLFFKYLGAPMDLAFNTLTAFTAAASVVVLYKLILKIFENRFLAFSTALLFSTMPVYLSITTHSMIHAFSVLTSLLSFYFLILAVSDENLAFYLYSAIFFIISVSSRFPNILLLLPLSIIFFQPLIDSHFKPGFINKNRFTQEMILFWAPIISFLIFTLVFQQDMIIGKAGYDVFLGFFSPVLFLAVNTIIKNVGLLGWFLLLLGTSKVRYYNKKLYSISLILWMLLLFFFYGNIISYSDRFLSIILPIIAFFISVSIDRIRHYNRFLSVLVLIFILSSMFYTVLPIIWDRHNYSAQKEYALWLKEQVPSESVIIVMDDAPFIEYYGGLTTKEHPIGDIEKTVKWVGDVSQLLNSGRPVYIVESGFTYDPEGIFLDALLDNFNLSLIGSHVNEDYHRASITRHKYDSRLIKIVQKKDSTAWNT